MSKKKNISLENTSPFELLHTKEGFELLLKEGLVTKNPDIEGSYNVNFEGILKLLSEKGGKDPGSWFKGM